MQCATVGQPATCPIDSPPRNGIHGHNCDNRNCASIGSVDPVFAFASSCAHALTFTCDDRDDHQPQTEIRRTSRDEWALELPRTVEDGDGGGPGCGCADGSGCEQGGARWGTHEIPIPSILPARDLSWERQHPPADTIGLAIRDAAPKKAEAKQQQRIPAGFRPMSKPPCLTVVLLAVLLSVWRVMAQLSCCGSCIPPTYTSTSGSSRHSSRRPGCAPSPYQQRPWSAAQKLPLRGCPTRSWRRWGCRRSLRWWRTTAFMWRLCGISECVHRNRGF